MGPTTLTPFPVLSESNLPGDPVPSSPADFSAGPPRPRLLLIEDERAYAQVISYNLEREGYEVIVAYDGLEGLQKAKAVVPDIIVLDLMLPNLDGIEVCRELRSSDLTREIPILILSAKSDESDQLIGFTMGADDYVTKPYSNKLLIQRIKALHRRSTLASRPTDIIENQGVSIDRVRHIATIDGKDLALTLTEFRLLECLLRQPGRTFSRLQLIDIAIGKDSVVLERNIDLHVATLRRKLGVPGLIETVRGVGYRFREAPKR